MNRLPIVAALLVIAAAPALAQTPPPAAPAQTPAPAQAQAPSTPGATPAAAPAKHNCGAKPEHPGKLASDNMKRAWQRDATAYLDCLRKFATDQQQLAQEYIKAANATVDEYNATIKEFQDAAKAAQ